MLFRLSAAWAAYSPALNRGRAWDNRAEVDLHERPKLSALLIIEDDQRVRRKRALLLRPVLERLERIALATVPSQSQPSGYRSQRIEGESFGTTARAATTAPGLLVCRKQNLNGSHSCSTAVNSFLLRK